jgi:hypothetical protein
VREYERVAPRDGRFAGFILYEADAFHARREEDGGYPYRQPVVRENLPADMG